MEMDVLRAEMHKDWWELGSQDSRPGGFVLLTAGGFKILFYFTFINTYNEHAFIYIYITYSYIEMKGVLMA